MKKKLLCILLFALALAACIFVACDKKVETTEVVVPTKHGAISAFDLISPTQGQETFVSPTFTWQEAQNADYYELELCSDESFAQGTNVVYVKKSGVTSTSFAIGATLRVKNATYFWRVTAVNADGKKACSQGYSSFYLKANEGEIEFDVNYADEWVVHEQGSKATVSVNEGDFFGNGKNSLVVSFVEEDTNRGEPSSDGWIVVTHSQESEMYGVDAFYFNFYYSGNDANAFLRVVDEDNEYWHAQIKLANNAKQTVIIKFDDFVLRTQGGTPIVNQTFDYNYIKYVELVFEKSFGDGVAMMSDLKAVNFADYGYLFMDKLDFNSVDESAIIYDNYRFDTTVSEDGYTMTYAFDNTPNELNAGGINGAGGYGFVKYPVEKLLVTGDAFAFDMEVSGNVSSAQVLIRLIEEDQDRWVYYQKISAIPEDGKLIVPFMAFTLSEYKGDGSRQFYFIKQFQFGVQSAYSAGSVTVSNFRVVSLADEIDDLYVSRLSEDGVIADFNDYGNNVELYYDWQTSDTNKDEVLAVEKDFAFGTRNICVKMGYKADMGPALYGTMFQGREGFNALKIWAKDASIKHADAAYSYLESVSAKMILSLYVNTGEEYFVVVEALSKDWTEYVFAFDDFALAEGYFGERTPLTSENLAGIKIAFQYYYYAQVAGNKVPYPNYLSGNVVYLDNIALTNAEASSQTELTNKLKPSADDPKVCVVDDFDAATDQTLDWVCEKGYDYEKLTISDQTASGAGNSLEMNYKGSTSVAYYKNVVVDSSVNATSLRVLLNGDGKATVYVNVYFVYANTVYKYRATLTRVAEGWHWYTIGFDNFVKVEGNGNVALNKGNVSRITKISFGIVNNDGSESSVFVDAITLDGNYAMSVNKIDEYGE